MAVKVTVSETQFLEYGRCPLRTQKAEYPIQEELAAAERTGSWLFDQAFEDNLPTIQEVRTYFDGVWKEEASRRCSRAGLITSRLHDLAVKYLVLQPSTPYVLNFGLSAVAGAYTVLLRPKKDDLPLILRLRWEAKPGIPDLINLSRWLHFRFAEPGYPMVKVLNYCLDSDTEWVEFFEEKEVRRQLTGLASNMANRISFPSAGDYCSDCLSHGCKEVFAKG